MKQFWCLLSCYMLSLELTLFWVILTMIMSSCALLNTLHGTDFVLGHPHNDLGFLSIATCSPKGLFCVYVYPLPIQFNYSNFFLTSWISHQFCFLIIFLVLVPVFSSVYEFIYTWMNYILYTYYLNWECGR